MARPTTSAQRHLTLMEELEKLEQSITLTLQEIDSNFSRAHRIVTSNILPLIDDYAKHSENVWESSKFWKQFFEASANVSLNSYEEPSNEEETVTETDTTQTDPATSSYLSTPSQQGAPDFATPVSTRTYDSSHFEESPNFETPEPTPRASRKPQMESYASPYEKLRREVQGNGNRDEASTPSDLPSTPRNQTMSEDQDDLSPLIPPSTARQNLKLPTGRTPANDPLLHRILDKNYRIQATPHSHARLPRLGADARTPVTGRRVPAKAAADDPDSSPMMEAPQLRPELFDSPAKNRAARVPGVSLLTPAKKKNTARVPAAEEEAEVRPHGKAKAKVWSSDSEEDDDDFLEGMSPPKTMHFHIPQGKLLKTPAKEASKRIVDDLLLTAGGNITDEYDDSPSVVGKGRSLEDDTF